MTQLNEHALYREHPAEGMDSIDFYTRRGRALHAQAVRESLHMMLDMFRSLGRRRRRTAGRS